MSDYRPPKVILREAELMASAPEVVADWLKDYKHQLIDLERDDELEAALLQRKVPLIDLALARFGINDGVLRELFERGDESLRVAALSNENILRDAILNHWKFVQDADGFDWLGKLSEPELFALFSNAALPNLFISDFFEGKGAWVALDRDRRYDAVEAMTDNLLAREDDLDFVDGWDNYSNSIVFDAAWRFASIADVDLKWAWRLGRLYRGLAPRVFSKIEPLEVARRWQAPADEGEAREREVESNEKGYLGAFQTVRLGLARLAAGDEWHHSKVRDNILNSEDVAIRCGGYSVFRFNPEEVIKAWEQDGKLAVGHLLENDKVWRKMETREALSEICGFGSEGEDYAVSYNRLYHLRDEQFRELHPDWFADEEPADSEIDDEVFLDKPKNLVLERIERLDQRMVTLQSDLKSMGWAIIIVIAVSVVGWFR